MSTTQSERLSFHLKTGDYFPMLATILGFLEETVESCTCGTAARIVPLESDMLKMTREDLMFLHENYRIVPISEITEVTITE